MLKVFAPNMYMHSGFEPLTFSFRGGCDDHCAAQPGRGRIEAARNRVDRASNLERPFLASAVHLKKPLHSFRTSAATTTNQCAIVWMAQTNRANGNEVGGF
jgi:hypothetical protein